MKHIILLVAILFVGCSKEPKEMEAVLFERSGQWITNDDYSDFFFFNRKVYNGPAYMLHRNGKKKEEGTLKMAINQVPGPAGIKRATRNIRGRMNMAWSRVHGPDFISMAKKSMKEILIKGFRLGNGTTIMTRVKSVSYTHLRAHET